MAADCAEVTLSAEEERAVPAHRDPADRDAAVSRDDLLQHHGAPPAVGAVVPVAVVSAIRKKHHGRARPEVVERVEERLAERSRRPAAATMEEDERPVPVLRRHDADLVQVAVHEGAVHGVALDPSAARGPVTVDHVAHDDIGGDRQDGDHG